MEWKETKGMREPRLSNDVIDAFPKCGLQPNHNKK